MVPAGRGVVAHEVRPLGAVGGDGAGQAGELGDGGRVLARRLEQVRDLKQVTGDLEVVVAVHGGVLVPRRRRVEARRRGLRRKDDRAAEGRGVGDSRSGDPKERGRGRLNSWNSDNSYSGPGQHRGTRRCGSRWVPSSRACPLGQRFTPVLSTR
ncbi:Exonuclease SbcC [Streptomyces murinus]